MKHDHMFLSHFRLGKKPTFMFVFSWAIQNVKIPHFKLYFLRCFGSMHSFALIV